MVSVSLNVVTKSLESSLDRFAELESKGLLAVAETVGETTELGFERIQMLTVQRAFDTGRLATSWQRRVEAFYGKIWTDIPYALDVEYGHDAHTRQVPSHSVQEYNRRTKSGKVVRVKAHTIKAHTMQLPRRNPTYIARDTVQFMRNHMRKRLEQKIRKLV